MNKPIPTVRDYMTSPALTIDAESDLAAARRLMRGAQIRHLPVMQGSSLVGLLSERDLLGVEAAVRDMRDLAVRDVMVPQPFSVPPEASLQEASRQMAEHKYGSAVVVQDGRVVGILTAVDVEAALERLGGPRRAG